MERIFFDYYVKPILWVEYFLIITGPVHKADIHVQCNEFCERNMKTSLLNEYVL